MVPLLPGNEKTQVCGHSGGTTVGNQASEGIFRAA